MAAMNPGFRGVVAFLGGCVAVAGALAPDVYSRPALWMLGAAAALGCVLAWQRRRQAAYWLVLRLLAYIECSERRPRAVARWDERVTDGMAQSELAEALWSGRPK